MLLKHQLSISWQNGGDDEKSHVIGLSLLVGVALGASAIRGLHAQAKPPVYVIIDVAGYRSGQANSERGKNQ
jgi:hypothetical protein